MNQLIEDQRELLSNEYFEEFWLLVRAYAEVLEIKDRMRAAGTKFHEFNKAHPPKDHEPTD